MSFPHATPDPSLHLNDDELLIAALALGAGALVVNGLLFIGVVALTTRAVRWLKS